MIIVYSLSRSLAREIALFQCDVEKDEEIDSLFQAIQQKYYGSLDCLIHSIAFANREDLRGEFSALSLKGFNTALGISAYSLIPLTRAAAPLMKGGGSVVAMTFQGSQRVVPGYNVMGVAKAALESEAIYLAAEFGPQGIRVNTVSAGHLRTLAARGIEGFTEMQKHFGEKTALGRNVTHEEVANTVLFLCSDASSGITASTIFVDAGYHSMAV